MFSGIAFAGLLLYLDEPLGLFVGHAAYPVCSLSPRSSRGTGTRGCLWTAKSSVQTANLVLNGREGSEMFVRVWAVNDEFPLLSDFVETSTGCILVDVHAAMDRGSPIMSSITGRLVNPPSGDAPRGLGGVVMRQSSKGGNAAMLSHSPEHVHLRFHRSTARLSVIRASKDHRVLNILMSGLCFSGSAYTRFEPFGIATGYTPRCAHTSSWCLPSPSSDGSFLRLAIL